VGDAVNRDVTRKVAELVLELITSSIVERAPDGAATEASDATARRVVDEVLTLAPDASLKMMTFVVTTAAQFAGLLAQQTAIAENRGQSGLDVVREIAEGINEEFPPEEPN
jgi:hypothetical protein